MPLPPVPNIAIVGAAGVVGEELRHLMERRSTPVGMLRAIGSERSAGSTLSFCGSPIRVEALDDASLRDVDLVFMAAGGDVARTWAPRFAEAGAMVIDNSSAFRMDPAVPLVVPEINAGDLPDPHGPGAIIANPNCSTIIALMALTPIDRLSRIERVLACTYQAASGGGRALMETLEQQTLAWADARVGRPSSGPAEGAADADARPYAMNLFSHDSPLDDDGWNQEEVKLRRESARIWGRPVDAAATCVRVPVLRAHTIALHVETAEPLDLADVRAAIEAFPGVQVRDDRAANRHPEPRDAAGGDDVLVGRLRQEPADNVDTVDTETARRRLALLVSGDQLRKGAALNALQIAEALFERAGFAPSSAPDAHQTADGVVA